MRVLFLSPTLPWPLDAGGRIRTWQLLRGVRELHERHEVCLWAVRQPQARREDEHHVREVCSELRIFERSPMPVPRHWIAPGPESWFHSSALEVALVEAYASGQFDLVHVDEMCLTRSLPEGTRPPEVLHHHKLDVELARGLHLAGQGTLLETMRWRALEEQAAARFHQHIFCTQEDARGFESRHEVARSYIVPNGVDLDYFTPRPVERDPHELLFLGSLDYEPNQDGLRCFFDEVWPELRKREPRASLVVVGRAPSDELRREVPAGVHLIADVEDVRPYLARAAALVVPLAIGGGSRLKIAEAMAMGCPVISTEIGAQGYARGSARVAPRIRDLLPLLLEALGSPDCATPNAADLTWSRSATSLAAAWSTIADR